MGLRESGTVGVVPALGLDDLNIPSNPNHSVIFSCRNTAAQRAEHGLLLEDIHGFDPCKNSLSMLTWKVLAPPDHLQGVWEWRPRECGICGEQAVEKTMGEGRGISIRNPEPPMEGDGNVEKKKKMEGKNNQKAQTSPGLVEKLHTKRAFLGKKDKALPLLEFRDTDVSFWELFTPGHQGGNGTAKKD